MQKKKSKNARWPEHLGFARKILKEIQLEYVVLQPAEKVCAARAAARPEGANRPTGIIPNIPNVICYLTSTISTE